MLPIYEITLEQLLKARDDRAERQKRLIETYGMPLISFTVNMPGPCKKTLVSGRIFSEGYSELVEKFTENGIKFVYRETNDLITGPEGYIVVDSDEKLLKEWVLQLEELHPLGRLFDFDVLDRDGRAVSREALGYAKRKCLLCDDDAQVCVRSRRHAVEELLEKINEMARSYFTAGEQAVNTRFRIMPRGG